MQKFFFDMKMVSCIEIQLVSSSRQMQKQLGIAEKLPSTSATRASATIKTLKYPWSTR